MRARYGLSRVFRSPCIPLGISVEKKDLEIVGLESGSGLIMGDFHKWAGREGRRVWQGALNVGFAAFHEGRGAGRKTTPGGHGLVSRKKIVNRKEKLQEKSTISSEQAEIMETLEISNDARTYKAVKEGLRDLKAGRVRPYREFAKELLISCRTKGQV
jgi:hypothetical protein